MGVTEALLWNGRGLGRNWSSPISDVPKWSFPATGLTTSLPAW